MSWNERPDGDLTFSAKASHYQILDKKTRKVIRTAPFNGYRKKKDGTYKAIDEPKYNKATEDIALVYSS